MGILPLKKRANRDKCSFATKQRMFGVFSIDEILRYRGTWFPGSRTLCHPGVDFRFYYRIFQVLDHRDPLVGSGRSWSSWQHPQPHCAS